MTYLEVNHPFFDGFGQEAQNIGRFSINLVGSCKEVDLGYLGSRLVFTWKRGVLEVLK